MQRVLKFLKYLPRHDIEPVVVTNAHGISNAMDTDLLELEEVRNTPVYRIGGERLQPYLERRRSGKRITPADLLLVTRSLLYIDIYQEWSRSILSHVVEIVEKENINCIYSTSPPHSVHFLGSGLRSECGIPWIMELRDSMTDWPLRKPGLESQIARRIERYHEKRFYRACDGLVFVTHTQRSNAGRRFPGLVDKLSTVITNGFDAADYADRYPDRYRGGRFNITFTGNLSDHDLTQFAAAITRYADNCGADSGRILLRVVGLVDPGNRAVLESLSRFIDVECPGFVSHAEVASYQQNADCLLLLQTSNFASAGNEMINAKLFEYIGAGRPVIGITPRGEQSRLIEENGLGSTAEPDDVDAIERAIIECRQMAADSSWAAHDAGLRIFTREYQAEQFANFVGEVMGQADPFLRGGQARNGLADGR